jgi:hypothetical protein
MRKLRIGYYALSQDLSHPGDRRRLIFWAKERGHEICLNTSKDVDLVVLSEKTNFKNFYSSKCTKPVIFDLIDAYLVKDSYWKDLGRGIGKVISQDLPPPARSFSKFISKVCQQSKTVICSTVEQEATIKPFCENTRIILDSHEEFPFLSFNPTLLEMNNNFQLLWEGMPYTLTGIKQVSSVLSKMPSNQRILLAVVTDLHHKRFFGKFIDSNTSKILDKQLGGLEANYSIVPWTKSNLVAHAKVSDIGVIPIRQEDPFQWLKPENRLLIMWRLGIPCLTSATPAYSRVSKAAGTDSICKSTEEWDAKALQLLTDKDKARLQVQRGQEYMEKMHTKEILLAKWDEAIWSSL